MVQHTIAFLAWVASATIVMAVAGLIVGEILRFLSGRISNPRSAWLIGDLTRGEGFGLGLLFATFIVAGAYAAIVGAPSITAMPGFDTRSEQRWRLRPLAWWRHADRPDAEFGKDLRGNYRDGRAKSEVSGRSRTIGSALRAPSIGRNAAASVDLKPIRKAVSELIASLEKD